jgi:hypothetical protein
MRCERPGNALADRDDLIRFDVLEDLGRSARPSHLESIDPGRRSEAKVLPLIVLAKMARSCIHFAHLGADCDRQPQLRAYAITIASLPNCSNEQRAATGTLIAEEVRRLPIVRDEEIQIAIVVDVARYQATTDLPVGEAGSALRLTSAKRPGETFRKS